MIAAPIQTTPQPTPPQPGEGREDFTVRAHRELMQAIPDPAYRNRVVWDAWDSQFGDALRERADQFFPADQYETRHDVCYWHEHEAVARGADGQDVVKKNDINRIAAIVRESNLRIEDTDAYAALVDKHTLPGAQRDPLPPKTLGFSGPYRIGMIGRVNPRFALFADEHLRKDRSEVLRDRPRRSVEVLTLRANGRSYIDPVAALSEAPRLPLPVQLYAADDELGTRERYEAVAAYPGGSNSFLPGMGKRRDKYAGDPNEPNDPANPIGQSGPPLADSPNQEQSMAITPDDLRQIVEAIQSTPQFQFLNSLMESGGQAGVGEGDGMGQGTAPSPMGPPAPAPPAGGMPGADPMAPPVGTKEGFGQNQYALPLVPIAAGVGSAMANRFGAGSPNDTEGGDEVDREQYAALAEAHDDLREQYQALANDNVELMQTVGALKRGFAESRAREVDASRRMQLQELHSNYPHFVDLSREQSKCLYSAGSTMTDEQFSDHLDDLETYAAKAPPINGRMIPGGDEPPRRHLGVESERYEAQVASTAVEIYSAAINAGKKMTQAEAFAAAKEKVGA